MPASPDFSRSSRAVCTHCLPCFWCPEQPESSARHMMTLYLTVHACCLSDQWPRDQDNSVHKSKIQYTHESGHRCPAAFCSAVAARGTLTTVISARHIHSKPRCAVASASHSSCSWHITAQADGCVCRLCFGTHHVKCARHAPACGQSAFKPAIVVVLVA